MNNTPPRISSAPSKISSTLGPLGLYPTSGHRTGRLRRFTGSTSRPSARFMQPPMDCSSRARSAMSSLCSSRRRSAISCAVNGSLAARIRSSTRRASPGSTGGRCGTRRLHRAAAQSGRGKDADALRGQRAGRHLPNAHRSTNKHSVPLAAPLCLPPARSREGPFHRYCRAAVHDLPYPGPTSSV